MFKSLFSKPATMAPRARFGFKAPWGSLPYGPLAQPLFSDAELRPHQPLPLPQGVELVSRRDIYSKDRTVLLLRAGQRVDRHVLPKLLSFGVTPEDFQYKACAEDLPRLPFASLSQKEEAVSASGVSSGMSVPRQRQSSSAIEHQANVPPALSSQELASLAMACTSPETNLSMPGLALLRNLRSKRALIEQQTVMILDPDERSNARLTDCLMACGVTYDHIHPVRLISQWQWAMAKYQPDFLFVSFDLQQGRHGLSVLEAATETHPTTRLILIADPKALKPDVQRRLTSLVAAYNSLILWKPIHRGQLAGLLLNTEQAATTHLPD
ncbi:MAG: hypothetical protein SFZ03_08885 [Candidatus Melainabacteria bacterium]|nr:hypothetical protein [Candidatus Melainabacteria bacterium]